MDHFQDLFMNVLEGEFSEVCIAPVLVEDVR